MDKDWNKLLAHGPKEMRDEVISLLIDAGSPGVLESEEFKSDTRTPGGSRHIYPSPYPSPNSRFKRKKQSEKKEGEAYLTAYLQSSSMDSFDELKEKSRQLGWTITYSAYIDDDWTIKWKEGLKPIYVTETEHDLSLIVKATWHEIRAGKDDIVIDVDPGMAFGTGSHPTTAMCLRALLSIISTEHEPVRSMLDMGSGTGILSIAAKKLGIAEVLGVDIDAHAIEIASENAKLNNVLCNFEKISPDNLHVDGLFDLVIANIISRELIKLAPIITKNVKPHGLLVLSGILTEEAREVKNLYTNYGFTPHLRYAQSASEQGGGNWVTFVLRNTA